VSCLFTNVEGYFVPDQQVLISSTGEDRGHMELLLKKLNEMSPWSLQVSGPSSKPRQENDDKVELRNFHNRR
jgi:hypothetical protein